MTHLVTELLLSLLGRITLFLMHRDVEKMRLLRDSEYNGQYSNAGRVYILNAVAFTGAVLIILFLLVFIGRIIYDAITGHFSSES